MKLFFLSVGLFVSLATKGNARPPAVDRIEVVHRFAAIVCAGVCRDERVEVSADGNIWWQFEPLKGLRPTRLRHFRVKPSAAAKYIQKMRAVLPQRSTLSRIGCDAEWHVRNRMDWTIRWSGIGRPTTLTSCDGDERIRLAWRSALAAIGMPDGLGGYIGDGVKELPSE